MALMLPPQCWMPDWHDRKIPQSPETSSESCIRFGYEKPTGPCPQGGDWVWVATPYWAAFIPEVVERRRYYG